MTRLIDQIIRNQRERELAETAEALAARFAERAETHDREGSFPFDNFAELREAGYLRLTVPASLGGGGISLYELVLVQERLARGDGATALAVGWHLGQMFHFRESGKWPQPLFRELCADVVRDGVMINTFASEAGSGSPSRGGKPETTAERTEGGWLLTGRKTFSTLSPALDRFVASAYVPSEDRVGEFLVRKGAGVSIKETWDTLGMRATGSHDVVLDRVFVPDGSRIDAAGGAAADDGGGWLLHIPACYSGIAFAARDFALQFAKSYRPNSLPGPIADLPTVRQQLGALEAELRSSRCLLYACADRWDRAAPGDRAALRTDLGLAKYAVTNAALRIADLAMRIVGGAALSKRLPLERYLRDIRAGLYNPPMDSSVLAALAGSALDDADPA